MAEDNEKMAAIASCNLPITGYTAHGQASGNHSGNHKWVNRKKSRERQRVCHAAGDTGFDCWKSIIHSF
ncbi:MAG: hypothetical protein EPO23_03735 [Xanthobacteraceae bacterium]|nr:MAG: hypothetical protein EPO23_03735 [Xanthobacteraceae bacterium]